MVEIFGRTRVSFLSLLGSLVSCWVHLTGRGGRKLNLHQRIKKSPIYFTSFTLLWKWYVNYKSLRHVAYSTSKRNVSFWNELKIEQALIVFCGENQLTMVIEGGSDQLFGELITFEDPILMPIISQPPMFTLPPPPSSGLDFGMGWAFLI